MFIASAPDASKLIFYESFGVFEDFITMSTDKLTCVTLLSYDT